ncbi:MAG TPA: glycosyl hydrolase family 18 protein [Chloroflexota bacterium]|nr:glycosyl hydrolase family 18 protein [Chloroflexota bacterium]
MRTLLAAAVLVVLAVIAGFLIYAHVTYPTTSAGNVLADLVSAEQHPHISLHGETMAFLPYWRLDNIQYARYDLLSEVNFFSLTIGPDGHIVQIIGNQTEPGWRWWNTPQVEDLIPRVQIAGATFGLTLAMLNNSDIRSFLAGPSAQENLIADTVAQVRARRLNAITLDVEYAGTPPAVDRREFTSFAERFSLALRQRAPGVQLSLTLPPEAGRDRGLFNLPALAPLFDRFIGMTYDYYNSSTAVAGPEAPMRGFSPHRYIFDVTTAYRDYLLAIPRTKIVMGIPYSGWDWAVRKGKGLLRPVLPPSNPHSYAAILSYGRMRSFAALNGAQCRWIKDAEEPHCWYTDGTGTRHSVWFENDRSIAVKDAYARAQGFAGIAIWVLGYDSKYPNLWDILRRTLQR